MRRFLLVGCGGTGGATLAYTIDQLRSELGARGLKLPCGWQFVHIDVPLAPDKLADGLGSVVQQGGSYIGIGPQSGKYALLDSAVCSKLTDLGGIATWAPTAPQEVGVPISAGAGQYRALGRMITVNRAGQILERLEAAWSDLSRIEADQEMSKVASELPGIGTYDPNGSAVVIVVSSMAGGSGASMALDVCRLLSLIRGVVPGLVGVFMFSADAFDSIPASARTGVRGNSLAMTGEIVAAQNGAARETDQRLLGDLGLQVGYGQATPFARVFPVGRFIGMDRTPFGDGTMATMYRALGRGLAALMTSERASEDFVAYDLGDPGGPNAKKAEFGWGTPNADTLAWGSFGYACLSTGHERYREYAAQRVARGAVDRLVVGHLNPNSAQSSQDRISALVDSQWEAACTQVGLPVRATDAYTWLVKEAFPNAITVPHEITASQVEPYIPVAEGGRTVEFVQTFRSRLQERKSAMESAANESAYRQAYQWHEEFAEKLRALVEQSIARFGLPYAIAVLDRIEALLRDIVPYAKAQASRKPADLGAVTADGEATLAGLGKLFQNGHQILASLLESLRGPLYYQVLSHGSSLINDLAPAIVTEYLAPMREAMRNALGFLQMSRDPAQTPASDVGLARLVTDRYLAWPSEDDLRVPDRFTHAVNEVMMLPASEYDAHFRAHLASSVTVVDDAFSPTTDSVAQYVEARETVLTQVIAGTWSSQGGEERPGRVLELTAMWRSRVFARDPDSGENRIPQPAGFDVHVRPIEILSRARAFVDRPGESFKRFIDASLRDLLSSTATHVRSALTDAERVQAEASMLSAFSEVLGRARPLISVSRSAVERIHGGRVLYRYKFSAVPFGDHSIRDQMLALLDGDQNIDRVSGQMFSAAMDKADRTVSRIEVFGSYANYSPVVFDTLLGPAATEWAAQHSAADSDFWKWRRARPIPAALPMADAERVAMVAGWYVGQIVGQLRVPEPPYNHRTGPVEIWDAEYGRWLAFPHPMLTPWKKFNAPYDALPAVLESSLLALAMASQEPLFASMRPYQLLRGLYDDDPEGPSRRDSGIVELSAERLIADWLHSGRTATGEPTRVTAADDAATPSTRADAVTAWLDALRGFVGTQYLPLNDSGSGDGVFSHVTQRRQASVTPLFRDIAPDVMTALTDVQAVMRRALSRLDSITTSSDRLPSERPGTTEEFRIPTARIDFR